MILLFVGENKMRKNVFCLQNGVVALITILLLGAVIVEISVAGAFLGTVVAQSGYTTRLSSQALAAADAGIQDALLRLARDSNSPNPSSTIVIDGVSLNIIICQQENVVINGSGNLACDPTPASSVHIGAKASIATVQRYLEAVVAIDSLTGDLRILSKKQI